MGIQFQRAVSKLLGFFIETSSEEDSMDFENIHEVCKISYRYCK